MSVVFCSELITKQFAVFSFDHNGEQKFFKIDDKSDEKIVFDIFNYLNELKDNIFVTLNGCKTLNILMLKKEMLILGTKLSSSLEFVHQCYRANSEGTFAINQYDLCNYTKKDINLKILMDNLGIEKIGPFTETNILKMLWEEVKDKIELMNNITYESNVPIIKAIENKLKEILKFHEDNKPTLDFNLSSVLFKETENIAKEFGLYDKLSMINVTNGDLKELINEKVTLKGLDITIGAGGIHAARKGFFDSDTDNKIISFDITSFYPSIIMNKKMSPRQCENFEEVYKEWYDKKMNGDRSYKDLINSVFGLSNNSESCIYDPYFFTKCTLNGELYTLKLLRNLSAKKTFIPLVVNTDGFEFIISREEEEEVMKLIEQFTHYFGFKYHINPLDKLIVQNVSSLIKVADAGVYSNKISINDTEVKSFESKGLFSSDLLKNNPLKSLSAKKTAQKLVPMYLLELKPQTKEDEKIKQVIR